MDGNPNVVSGGGGGDNAENGVVNRTNFVHDRREWGVESEGTAVTGGGDDFSNVSEDPIGRFGDHVGRSGGHFV